MKFNNKLIFYNNPNYGNTELVVCDTNYNFIEKKSDFDPNYKNIRARLLNYGGILGAKKHYYVFDPVSLVIFKYNMKNNLIFSFPIKFSGVLPIEKDLSKSFYKETSNFWKEYKSVTIDKTFGYNYCLLNENRIIVQLIQSREKTKFLTQMFDVKGKIIFNEPIISDNKLFEIAKDNKAYDIVLPEPDPDGNIPNPEIHIYKYVGE